MNDHRSRCRRWSRAHLPWSLTEDVSQLLRTTHESATSRTTRNLLLIMSLRKRQHKLRSFSKSVNASLTSVSWATTALFSPTDKLARAKPSPFREEATLNRRVSSRAASSTYSQRSARSRISICWQKGSQAVDHQLDLKVLLLENKHSTTRPCLEMSVWRRSNLRSSANM